MVKTIRSFLKSIDFFKSITLLFAILVPLALLRVVGKLTLAIGLITGVLLGSPSNIPGSIRHMAVGILVGSLLAVINTFAIQMSLGSTWILMPVLSGLIFFSSMLSVYGFRASLVSFSGLLAIVLAFAHPTTGIDLLRHLWLILAGGLWYLVVTMFAHSLVYRRQTQLILSECMTLTAQYLRVRGKLIQHPQQTDALQKELLRLQTDINEKHEKLREIFVTERTRSGTSHSANKNLLIFIELVEILELALSSPADYPRVRSLFAKREELLTSLVDMLGATAGQLERMATVVAGDRKLSASAGADSSAQQYEQLLSHFDGYLSTHPSPDVFVLSNLLGYEQQQQQKVKSIERILRNLADQNQIIRRSQEIRQFMTHQDYDLRVIKQNLSPHSVIFRHAIRLTVTMIAGYTLGALLPIQNPYWIMLTIIVIMRPSYGLTKSRSIQRVIGTLIGGGIALGTVLFTSNPYVYGALAAISLVLGFSLIQKNYGGAAVFITLYVIFLYALLQPDALPVIQFRVLDTVLGTGLAFLAGLLLWPSWEVMNIRPVMADSIRAIRRYLQEIIAFYQEKGALPITYKLARKEAFLANGDLNAAFQRMSQEPKSKRPHFSAIYEMVALNHTLLSATAAIGTFIQHHHTTEKSQHLQTFVDGIDRNLERAQVSLSQEELDAGRTPLDLTSARSYLDDQYEAALKQYQEYLPQGRSLTLEKQNYPWQEVSLMVGQLQWLYLLSENLRKAAEGLTQPGK